MKDILEADGIQLNINNKRILSDIYIKCECGKLTVLVGRNGQGKSSLMQIIFGTLSAEKSVRINHTSFNEAYKRPDLVRYLPQFNFIPKNLIISEIFKDYRIDFESFNSLFGEFKGKQNNKISTLSLGERRIIELYIILRSISKFILLDEPFIHLSPIQIQKINNLIEEEIKGNKGIIITDHLYYLNNDIINITSFIYLLSNGKLYSVKDVREIEKWHTIK